MDEKNEQNRLNSMQRNLSEQQHVSNSSKMVVTQPMFSNPKCMLVCSCVCVLVCVCVSGYVC